MKEIAIYGMGGFGREVACLLRMINEVSPTWKLVGFFDDGLPKGEEGRYGPVLGGIDELNAWDRPLSVVISIANSAILKKIATSVHNPRIDFPNIIAPNAIFFDPEALDLGVGNIIFLGVRLSCDVKIGHFNHLGGAVCFGHDVEVGNYNVFSPSVRLSGGVIVGDSNFFGVQSTVLQYQSVGSECRIGAGSILMKKAKDFGFYMGNPAKRIEL